MTGNVGSAVDVGSEGDAGVGGDCARLLPGELGERQRLGFDHAQAAFLSKLAAEQAHGFEIGVDLFITAGDEAGNEDALKRRDVQLGLDRRFDGDFEVARAPGERADERQEQATDRLS